MINEDFFSVIDSEVKAYLLGFITADGCITDNKNTLCLQVHISNKDRYIIDLLEEHLGSTMKTYYSEKYDSVCFRCTSNKLCEDLAKHHIVPRKTGCEMLSESVLTGHFANHYIRGLIDGDGWICRITSTGRLSIGFCSSEQACTQMRNYMSLTLGVCPVKVCRVNSANNYKINYLGASDTQKIFDMLYDDANFYLQRKKNAGIK